MKIIGISGIDGTVDFKRQQWPGLSEREYRISQGHDSAAALVVDGEFVFGVAEERISRRKHTGDFPIGAIRSCLDWASLRPDEIDEIVHGFDYAPYRAMYALDPVSRELYGTVLSREAFALQVARALPEFPLERVRHVDHHLAHAASAYLTSGWDECLVVVIDGMGEAHAATIYHAHDGQLEILHRISAVDSLGILYSVVTLHLGFDFNSDEYKIMGLAPYGDPQRFAPFFDSAVRMLDDGGWEIPPLKLGVTREQRENHSATRQLLTEQLIAPRDPESDIEPVHQDVAAALQACLDRAILHLGRHFGASTGLRRLAMAGGVALNTTANGRLLASGAFDEIYVQPAAADDGSALGAALHRAALANEIVNRRSPTPFYGPEHSDAAVAEALRPYADRIDATPLTDLPEACAVAADLITAGEVIAWYRGRMEFGPRALGHRSILADPGRADMRDRVNALVKMREAFRPFAPAVSLEQVDRWFDTPPRTELPYMTVNVNVRPEYRDSLPAITHVDGSARVQTVSAQDNPEFHSLLRAVGERNGREIVLNTSFNVKGQAIVNTPAEALETLLNCGIEALFLGNIFVRKR
jgi:carbamoyltransferase